MKLKSLLSGVDVIENILKYKDIEIDTLSLYAQNKMQNGMFFCFAGKVDGFKLVGDAIANGAVVIVCEKYIECECEVVVVKDIRVALAIISQNFYDTKDVKVIGITGTNGKTTTSFIIKNILEQSGKRVGLIGTNGIYFQNEFIEAKLTTPDPIDLHHILSIMKKAKIDFVVMEVSAHAIALKKVYGVNFVCKILTNLTQDHLDYFKTMQNYAKAKESFFDEKDLMIVNVDDSLGQKVASKFETCVTFGLKNPSDAFCVDINKDCTSYVMNICDNVTSIHSNLFGMFNVYNALASATCCYFLGANIDTIKNGIESVKNIDGRFNVITFGDKKIIIDFAHTPDGLENVLKTANDITDGQLYCLFGCGGNRDKKKRKLMGAIADKYSSFCFITSDNPRFEKPQKIIDEIAKGFNSNNYYKIEDRKTAIKLAISSLKDGDTLIICGKGGENYIEINGQKCEYNDLSVVKEILGEMRWY